MQPTRKRGLIYKLDFSFRLVQNLSCPKKHKKSVQKSETLSFKIMVLVLNTHSKKIKKFPKTNFFIKKKIGNEFSENCGVK